MTATLQHTDYTLTTDVRITDAPPNPSRDGYGPKIPTRFMLHYAGRWRRVYMMQYGNSGTPYVIHQGEDAVLDIDTEALIDLAIEVERCGH